MIGLRSIALVGLGLTIPCVCWATGDIVVNGGHSKVINDRLFVKLQLCNMSPHSYHESEQIKVGVYLDGDRYGRCEDHAAPDGEASFSGPLAPNDCREVTVVLDPPPGDYRSGLAVVNYDCGSSDGDNSAASNQWPLEPFLIGETSNDGPAISTFSATVSDDQRLTVFSAELERLDRPRAPLSFLVFSQHQRASSCGDVPLYQRAISAKTDAISERFIDERLPNGDYQTVALLCADDLPLARAVAKFSIHDRPWRDPAKQHQDIALRSVATYIGSDGLTHLRIAVCAAEGATELPVSVGIFWGSQAPPNDCTSRPDLVETFDRVSRRCQERDIPLSNTRGNDSAWVVSDPGCNLSASDAYTGNNRVAVSWAQLKPQGALRQVTGCAVGGGTGPWPTLIVCLALLILRRRHRCEQRADAL